MAGGIFFTAVKTAGTLSTVDFRTNLELTLKERWHLVCVYVKLERTLKERWCLACV